MATLDRTKITKPSPIVEDEQGQLRARQGISREVVSELSKVKGEPDWMAEKRLKSLEIFERKPIPTWGPDLGGLRTLRSLADFADQFSLVAKFLEACTVQYGNMEEGVGRAIGR